MRNIYFKGNLAADFFARALNMQLGSVRIFRAHMEYFGVWFFAG